MERLEGLRYVPAAFHRLIQLPLNAAGSIKFLFLNDGDVQIDVQIKAIPGATRNLCKAQRSDLEGNITLHLYFIQLGCSDPSRIVRLDRLCPVPGCHLGGGRGGGGGNFSWHCPCNFISYFRLHSELGHGGGNSIACVRG